MKRSPLTRKTPLRSAGQPARNTTVRAVSDRRRKRDAGYNAAREAIRTRCADRCEAMATVRCTGRYEQAHHRAGRGGSDPHRPDNLLAVCAPCHAWIHAHPADAFKHGWSRPRNRRNDD